MIERTRCPGCGAPLDLEEAAALVRCPYCGSQARVIRRLRLVEPDLPPVPPPRASGNPESEFESWNTEQLVKALLEEPDGPRAVAMADALDEWCHANERTAAWTGLLVERSEGAAPEVDRAVGGVLGKLVCHDDLRFRLAVIRVGQERGFRTPLSRALLWALSLGAAGTLKLLLDIAEHAAREGREADARDALMAAQTALGREGEQLPVCMDVLLYRLPDASGPVQEWMLATLWRHFDVGYSFLYPRVVELLEDCARERPGLMEPAARALRKCRRASDPEEFAERIAALEWARSGPALKAGCEALGEPPAELPRSVLERAVARLAGLLAHPEAGPAAVEGLRRFLWVWEDLPDPLLRLAATPGLPEALARSLDLRLDR